MSKAKKILKNGYRPSWWRSTAGPYILDRVMEMYFDRYPASRCEIMNEDWDNLLLLDGCRYDMFQDQCSIDGRLQSRISQGASTFEFFDKNFSGHTHHDTVYVTANPVPRVDEWCSVDIDAVFYAVVDVWKDHWDSDLDTVRPEPVTAALKRANERFPSKRILGHYLQPHYPFIGHGGWEIESRGMTAYDRLSNDSISDRPSIWERLDAGEVSREFVWKAYRENLEVVLPHAREVADVFEGKTVLSSDHGNLLREFAWPFPIRTSGHPPGIHTKNLVTVPWLEIEYDTRKSITEEEPVARSPESATADAQERLKALGYR